MLDYFVNEYYVVTFVVQEPKLKLGTDPIPEFQ